MNRTIYQVIAIVFLFSVSIGNTQTNTVKPEAHQKTSYLAVYRRGPGCIAGKSLKEQPLQEHRKYMLRLYTEGTMKSAGPFLDDTGGALIFEAASEEDAKAVIAADPAVRSGIFVSELHPWQLIDWAQSAKAMATSRK